MTIETYSMHPTIEQSFQIMHEKFESDPATAGYLTCKAKKALFRKDKRHAAFNFHYFFPTHFYKACHALRSENIIGLNKLAAWLQYNPYLVVIDVGCGDGAGSIAVAETILLLRERKLIDRRPIELFCLGIDKNILALSNYELMVNEVKCRLVDYKINLDFETCPQHVYQSTTNIDEILTRKLSVWKKPSLSHAIAIASNITDILKEEYDLEKDEYKKLKYHKPVSFGVQLANLYRIIFESIPIDHLYEFTIDTEPDDTLKAVEELNKAINEQFHGRGHSITQEDVKLEKITIKNPISSFF